MSHLRILKYSVIAGFLLLAGCSSKEHDAIVAKIGDKPVTLKEYEDLYIKSNGSREASAKTSQEEREKFLELVTKFKLKLTDAYALGLNKKPELQAEIDQYKSSLASSFLTEREITAPGVRKMFDSKQNEYRASHILISVSPTAAIEESLAAQMKADSIVTKLKAGANFEELAVQYSQDPSVAQNKGDLYYFTAGQMVPPFEDAVATMKVGEITMKPVRTQFGLHIIKLVGKKPARGEIKASHIMIRFEKQDPGPDDTLKAYETIKKIQDSLKTGIDFAELAQRNSGDPGSASKGGDLGWFQRRRWIQSFDEVVQNLKPGETSGIVRTVYGFHLIKCYDEHPAKSFEDSKKDIQQLYQQTRFQDDYKSYFGKVKKETLFMLHEETLRRFIAGCDSNKTTKDSAWWSTIPAAVRSAALITFGNRSVSVDSMVKLINARPDFNNTPLRDPGIRNMVDKISESLVFAVRAETLEKDSPEFAAIMKEYTDGILLYQIEQDRVWNSVAVNDSVLKAYFNNNSNKFMFPDRVDFTEVRAANDSVAHLIYTQAQAGKRLEDIAAADSVRMAQKSSFQVEFTANSAKLGPQMIKILKPLVDQLKADAGLRVQLTSYPDTSAKKTQNQKLATLRADAIKAYFKKENIGEDRVSPFSQPYNRKAMVNDLKDKNALNLRVKADIIARRPMVIGRVETALLPVTTDERTMKADSLKVGAISTPLMSKSSVTIVRLNKKEPLRQKTFEEAGTEVSSSFQEYESKRLEKEWIDGLRKKYPVVEYKEALKSAFAPTK